MNWRRVRAVAWRESLEVVRDPRSLALALAIPLLLLILFGYALSLDVDEVPTIVFDQDGTPESRELVGRFIGSPYFRVIGSATDARAVAAALDDGRALAGIIIPSRFGQDLRAGRNVQVQMLLDGSDANTAGIALGYASGLVGQFSRTVELVRLGRYGVMSHPAQPELRPRVWYNEPLRGTNYIVPGLIAVILAVVGTFLTALTLSRERERGTMEVLLASPLRPAEIVIGKVVPYFVAALFDAMFAAAVGVLIFGVPFRGSVALFLLSSCLFLLCMLGLGLVISARAVSQADAYQYAIVASYLPALLLSGFVFTISNMPWPIRLCTYLVPARYFVAVQRAVFLKGTGLGMLWLPIMVLALFATALWLLAVRSVKTKLE